MIIPINKTLGASTHQLAEEIGRYYGEKATHTGTLDPLAEGVVVVLTGEDRYRKEELSQTRKVYRFSILWGVATDSDDVLGRIQTLDNDVTGNLEERIRKRLPSFVGLTQQAPHPFSAKRIQGRSSFDLAKAGQEISGITPVETEIFRLELESVRMVPITELKRMILFRLSTVHGPFRQESITADWRKVFTTWESLGVGALPCYSFEVESSRRMYVRTLVRQISAAVDVPGVVYSLVRIRNGIFSIEQCREIEEFRADE